MTDHILMSDRPLLLFTGEQQGAAAVRFSLANLKPLMPTALLVYHYQRPSWSAWAPLHLPSLVGVHCAAIQCNNWIRNELFSLFFSKKMSSGLAVHLSFVLNRVQRWIIFGHFSKGATRYGRMAWDVPYFGGCTEPCWIYWMNEINYIWRV